MGFSFIEVLEILRVFGELKTGEIYKILRSGGPVNRNSIMVVLLRLVSMGLLSSNKVNGERVWRLTPYAKKILEKNNARSFYDTPLINYVKVPLYKLRRFE